MIGSAVQNSIALSDSIFLFYYDETDFAAIGLVSVFYLIVSAIGYGFSKGGQILIARKAGQSTTVGIGNTLANILFFQFITGLFIFALLYLGGKAFLSLFIDNPLILNKCWEYLSWRAWSIVFSYVGLGFIAFYTGISRTIFIMIDVALMLLVNVVLNYALIFGKFGFPEMGIRGAGLASAIAETIAFIAFLIYILTDKHRKEWNWKRFFNFDFSSFRPIFKIGMPVVAQMVIGLGSWFIFFAFIEGYGERALAMTNLGRIMYLFFSIPCWGYASGINTIASFLIGQGKSKEVLPVTRKTVLLALATTMILAAPVLLAPAYTLSFLSASDSYALIIESADILRMILLILALFCIGGIYFNGLVGTGDTMTGLYIQLFGVILYVIYLYIIVKVLTLPLIYAWTGELFYWATVIILTTLYLRSGKWEKVSL